MRNEFHISCNGVALTKGPAIAGHFVCVSSSSAIWTNSGPERSEGIHPCLPAAVSSLCSEPPEKTHNVASILRSPVPRNGWAAWQCCDPPSLARSELRWAGREDSGHALTPSWGKPDAMTIAMPRSVHTCNVVAGRNVCDPAVGPEELSGDEREPSNADVTRRRRVATSLSTCR